MAPWTWGPAGRSAGPLLVVVVVSRAAAAARRRRCGRGGGGGAGATGAGATGGRGAAARAAGRRGRARQLLCCVDGGLPQVALVARARRVGLQLRELELLFEKMDLEFDMRQVPPVCCSGPLAGGGG